MKFLCQVGSSIPSSGNRMESKYKVVHFQKCCDCPLFSGLDHVCLKSISTCPQQTLLVLITRFAQLKQQISVWSKSAHAHNKYFWSWSYSVDWSSKCLFETNTLVPTTNTSGLDCTLWVEAANVCLTQISLCPWQTLPTHSCSFFFAFFHLANKFCPLQTTYWHKVWDTNSWP